MMRIYNICSSLSTNIIKHVQLQKMAGCETMTSYSQCGIPKYARKKCGNLFAAANVETLAAFADLADVVMIHTSSGSADLLRLNVAGKPVIWACHDYVKVNSVPKALKAIVVPSYGYSLRFGREYGVPVHIIHRKVASDDWPKWSEKRIACTAMPGIVSDNPETPYRDYSTARSMLVGRFMVMSAEKPAVHTGDYMTMELVEPDIMLKNLAMFDTLWAGSGNDKTTFDEIVNNKMHEGIAAGAVPILYRSREMSEYADQYKCGITWGGSYPSQDELYECRRMIKENKRIHCLEFELPILQAILSKI
jgi:hypothetical protein